MSVLRALLLKVSRIDRIRDWSMRLPISRRVVRRFVAGETTADALDTCRRLAGQGLLATVDHLGEDTLDLDRAEATTAAYLELLAGVGAEGLADSVEVSVKLSALGQALGPDGEQISLRHARQICRAAADIGTTVTIDMEDHTTTDATLAAVRALRAEFPDTAAVVQAYLHRTEADVRTLTTAGSRVRLCKGAYDEPEAVAFTGSEIELSYVRCLTLLMAGEGRPLVATHHPRLIEIAGELARRHGRDPRSWEYQMLLGIRPDEQARLAAAGHPVRVYVPYGTDWYGYLVRRMAEKPANLGLFLRALVQRG